MANLRITLKNAKQVFPNQHTKVRREDIISIISEKSEYLSSIEKKKLENMAGSLENRGQFESIATRKGRTIEFINLD